MKTAIPTFRGRVSPVFDWAERVLLVEPAPSGKHRSNEVTLRGVPPELRAQHLAQLGVDTLLCGGISRDLLFLVRASGIRVIPWVAGSVDDVIEAYLAGCLPSPGLAMPGCSCAMKRRRRRRRGKGPLRWKDHPGAPEKQE